MYDIAAQLFCFKIQRTYSTTYSTVLINISILMKGCKSIVRYCGYQQCTNGASDTAVVRVLYSPTNPVRRRHHRPNISNQALFSIADVLTFFQQWDNNLHVTRCCIPKSWQRIQPQKVDALSLSVTWTCRLIGLYSGSRSRVGDTGVHM